MPAESSSRHNSPTLHSLPRSHKGFLLPSTQDEEGESSTDSSARVSELVSISTNSPERSPISSTSPHSPTPKYKLFTPIDAFQKLEQAKEVVSLLTPSLPPSAPPEGFSLPLLGELRWDVLKAAAIDWLKNPKNLALSLWGLAVGVSGALLFLVMVGLLDKQLPQKSQRDAWFEVNNQILNALFTLMVLYLHPQRCLHLVMLLRWKEQDISKLREVYCKNGTYKPHEWVHMLVVVVLLHVNCLAQYALCGLNWGFRRSQRPPVGVGLCLTVAIGAPALAGIYSILSPLGKDLHVEEDDEIQMQETAFSNNQRLEQTAALRIGRPSAICCGKMSFSSEDGALVQEPVWRGNLFECCSDPRIAVISTVCPFCVFGWNMERLGFGNRYVHIVTFILLCTAPYWIFNLAAINIDNPHVRRGLSVSGIILSIFGLLYGGFWRNQMRKTFGLPVQNWCFGKPILADCIQWLFCGPCSLCQEVRTSEQYNIQGNNFYEHKCPSEISVSSPSSEWISPGAYPFELEAASPISFTKYQNVPSALLPESTLGFGRPLSHEHSGRRSVFMEMANGDPMQPPALQVLHEGRSSF